jgi:hypothetical protein
MAKTKSVTRRNDWVKNGVKGLDHKFRASMKIFNPLIRIEWNDHVATDTALGANKIRDVFLKECNLQ